VSHCDAIRQRPLLGAQTAHPNEVLLRMILAERRDAKSYARIARDLNAEGITTVRGGRWYPPAVQRAAESQRAQALTGSLSAPAGWRRKRPTGRCPRG
jgi:hypothetical protein